ncbi:SsrA-binding protein SmpB [Oxalicibacterium solurbis]|nr:SsrA-binding protein SmpB [Oxalicibacterium solurbis]
MGKDEENMSIVDNKKAFHDYAIEDRYEAGVMLQGWEVKAIRAGRVQLKEAYVIARDNEIFLFGAHVSSLESTSSFSHPEARRTRKLLLHTREIDKLVSKVAQAGYTMVPLDLHWVRGRVKCSIALAKGKREYDKRHTERERDWQREQQRIMKVHKR